MTIHPIGVIHGRFQPFHIGHLEYVLAGIKRVRYMYIGITNPDPQTTRPNNADIHRSDPDANPCMFYERYRMIEETLLGEGLSHENFCIVPFPINIPSLWKYYVPLDAVFFLTVYDDWGERKLQMLTDAGLKTEVLWRRSRSDKFISGTEVRLMLAEGGDWRSFVPKKVADIIVNFNIEVRVRQLLKSSIPPVEQA